MFGLVLVLTTRICWTMLVADTRKCTASRALAASPDSWAYRKSQCQPVSQLFGRFSFQFANFLFLKGGLFASLIGCTRFPSSFLDISRLPPPTVSFCCCYRLGILKSMQQCVRLNQCTPFHTSFPFCNSMSFNGRPTYEVDVRMTLTNPAPV